MRSLLLLGLAVSTVMRGGVILEVSDGPGPGGGSGFTPILQLPYSFTLGPSGTGSNNICVDPGGDNQTCTYENDTGFTWGTLSVEINADPGGLICGGDLFLACNAGSGNGTTAATFLLGSIPDGKRFHFILSGWPDRSSVQVAIPEPGPIGLIALGLGAIFWVGRRRR